MFTSDNFPELITDNSGIGLAKYNNYFLILHGNFKIVFKEVLLSTERTNIPKSVEILKLMS